MRAGIERLRRLGTACLALLLLALAPSAWAQASLVVKAMATPRVIAPGGTIHYTVTVGNTGNAAAGAFLTRITIPTFTTTALARAPGYYSSTCSSATSCIGGQTISWYFSSGLAAGATASFTFAVTVDNTSPPVDGTVTSMVATATLAAVDYVGSIDTTITSVAAPQLAMTALPAQVSSGGTVTYLLTYGNPTAGPLPLTLRFTLPAGSTFSSASSGGTLSAGVVTWSLGTLAAGASGQQSVTMTLAGTAGSLPSAAADLVNTGSLVQYARADRAVALSPPSASPVALALSATPDPVVPGGTLSLNVTASNPSASPVSGFYVYVPLPSYATAVVAHAPAYYSDTCPTTTCRTGESIYYYISGLASGESRTLTLTVAIDATSPPPAGTVLTAQARSTLAGAAAWADIAVAAPAKAALSVIGSPTLVAAGGTLTYTLDYGNASAVALAAASLRLQLPPQVTFVSATGGGTLTGSVVDWSLGAIAAGDGGHREVTVQVNGGVASGTPLLAAARLIDASSLEDLARSTAVDSVASASASPVALSMSVTGDPALPGSLVTYTITATNQGAAVAPTFYAYFPVPPHTTSATAYAPRAYSNTCTSAASCLPGQYIYFQFAGLAAGESSSVQVSVVVDAVTPPAAGDVITARAVTGESGSAARAVLAAAADRMTVSLAESPDIVPPGGTQTYTVTYGNASAGPITPVVQLRIPSGSTFVSATGGGVAANGVVTWSPAALGVGASGQQQVVVSIGAGVPSGTPLLAIANVADAATGASLARASRASSVSVPSSSPGHLSMSATPDPVEPGKIVTFTITASNPGNAAMAGFYVYASVPGHTTTTLANAPDYYSSTCSSSISCLPGQTIYWYVSGLAAGASRSLQYSVTVDAVNPPPNGSLVTATAVSSANGSASQSVVVSAVKKLELALTDSPNLVAPGGTLTYLLNYGNPTGTTSNTSLKFLVPSGTTFASASTGASVSGSLVTWTLGSLAPGQSGQQQVSVTVSNSLANGNAISASADLYDTATGESFARAETTSTVTVGAASPVLLSLITTHDPVAPGSVATYTVTASNPSASATAGFYITVVVPSYTTSALTYAPSYHASTCSSATSCLPGQVIRWYLSSLAGGASTSFQFSLVVDATNPPPDGTVITTTVTTSLNSAVSQDLIVLAAPRAELALTDAPNFVAPGGQVTYTLTYGNSTNATLDGTLRFLLPPGTSFVSSPDGTAAGDVVTWTLGTLRSGARGTKQVTLLVGNAVASGTPLVASANLVRTGTQVSESRAEVATMVATAAASPVGLAVTASRDAVGPGGQVSFTATATNRTASPLTGFYVTLVVPRHLSTTLANAPGYYSSSCSSSVSCRPGQYIYWYVPSLAAGASASVSLTLNVDTVGAPAKGSVVVLQATATSPTGGLGSARASKAVVVGSISAGDFNADGRGDLVWRQNSTGWTVLWYMNGAANTGAPFIGGSTDWSVVARGDFDGDGQSDLLWRQTSTGAMVMWLMSGSTIVASAYLGGSTDWDIVSTGDFDGDGKTDLLWRQVSTGYTVMWLMNGTVAKSTLFVGGSSDWTVIASGDFNSDGRTDLVWRQISTGVVFVWLMDGASIQSMNYMGGSTDFTVVLAGDFNGDGKADLLWRQLSTGATIIWWMDGATVVSTAYIGGSLDWSVIASGDFDGDGKTDLIWRQTPSGQTLLWTLTSQALLGGSPDWYVVGGR